MPDGTDLHVEVVEPTRPVDGHPTVVLVHGFCLDMGTFHFQRKMLAERGEHRIVAYDQPGHGRSGPAGERRVRPDRARDALRRVIDETAPEGPLVLVGPLDGRHDHHGAGRAVPGDVRRPGGRHGADGHLGRPARGDKLVAPALLGRVGAPVLLHGHNATRYGGTVIDRARRSTTNVAWLLTRRYGFGTARAQPGPGVVRGADELAYLRRHGDPLPAYPGHPLPVPGAGRAGRYAGAGDRRRRRT